MTEQFLNPLPIHPNIFFVWARILSYAFISFALMVFAVVGGYLATRKYIGHRRLIVVSSVFFGCISLRLLSSMLTLYFGIRESKFVLAWDILCAVLAIPAVWTVLQSFSDLVITFVLTEADDAVRVDCAQNTKTRDLLFDHMTRENSANNQAWLMRYLGRDHAG